MNTNRFMKELNSSLKGINRALLYLALAIALQCLGNEVLTLITVTLVAVRELVPFVLSLFEAETRHDNY